MKNFVVKKVGLETLIPASEMSAEYIHTLKAGETYELKPVGQIRCAKLHGKFFVMLTNAWRNLPEQYGEMSFENFRKSVTIAAGYFEEIQVPIEGYVYTFRQPKSIAYHSMDQKEFEKLYQEVHKVLCKEYGMAGVEDFILNFM